MPFDVAAQDGVLTLTLDTPGSPINIFNHATAHQLIEIMSTVTTTTTRAVVFQTAKPHSFINGVGLLLAHAAQTYADIERASTPPWQAYRAVREAPVPTIAVIQGNCFGCGVEFALNCDYRIASDTGETQFYMTELNDYLFIPLFGSTWNLPATVGMADAIDLLLWGERWDARRAGERGLIDAVASHEDLTDQADQLVAQAIERPRQRRGAIAWHADVAAAVARARRRIAELPAEYQPVYEDALQLLITGAKQTESYDTHQRRELQRSAASALAPIGKAAYAFFYLRQMASERAAGRARDEAPVIKLGIAAQGDAARDFGAVLGRRRLPGVTLTPPESGDFRLHSPPAAGLSVVTPGVESAGDVTLRLTVAAEPTTDNEIYAPAFHTGVRLLELATRPRDGATGNPTLAPLARTLQRFGFVVARTTPTSRFVTTRLLVAYLSPLLRELANGGDAAIINRSLRAAGFIRLPGNVLGGVDLAALAQQIVPAGPGVGAEVALQTLCDTAIGDRQNPAIINALCLSLLAATLSTREERAVRDPSIIDVIARELLDFPRHLCSLCTWLKRARVGVALQDHRALELVDGATLEMARAFLAEGREFYR